MHMETILDPIEIQFQIWINMAWPDDPGLNTTAGQVGLLTLIEQLYRSGFSVIQVHHVGPIWDLDPDGS